MTRLTRVATTLIPLLLLGVLNLALSGEATPASQPGDTPTGRVCVLRDFSPTDGGPGPYSPRGSTGLIAEGPDGDLYSTTPSGGTSKKGTIFRIRPSTRQLTVLHSFDGLDAGEEPHSGLIDGRNGYFYGATYMGGQLKATGTARPKRGTGTVFRFRPGDPAPKIEILHTFRNGEMTGITPEVCLDKQPCQFSPQQRLNAAGAYPMSAPVLASDGQFYGVAASSNYQAWGVLYKVEPYKNKRSGSTDTGITALCIDGDVPTDPNTTDAQLRDRCMFSGGRNGNNPVSLTAGPNGVLYGVTLGGAPDNPHGTVFKATLSGRVQRLWKFDLVTGSAPYSVTVSQDGQTLYGSTLLGGIGNPGRGLVYKLTPGGVPTVLHMFNGGLDDGSYPMSGLVEKRGANGETYLYGSTRGGAFGRGVLYRVGTSGDDYKILYKFPGDWRAAGRTPEMTMVEVKGDFYGTTAEGGIYNGGVFFRLSGVDLAVNKPTMVRPIAGKDPTVVTATLSQLPDVKIDPEKQVTIEVRTKFSATQVKTGCVVSMDDLIRIKVSNCRNAHIVQLISRQKEDENGALLASKKPEMVTVRRYDEYVCEGGNLVGKREFLPPVEYGLTTNEQSRIWHTDQWPKDRTAYYDENPHVPIERDEYSLSIFDRPTFGDRNLYPGNPHETWRAIAEDYIVCNCQVIAQVRWSRVSRWSPRGRLEEYVDPNDPKYGIKIVAPAPAADVKRAIKQVEGDGLVMEEFSRLP